MQTNEETLEREYPMSELLTKELGDLPSFDKDRFLYQQVWIWRTVAATFLAGTVLFAAAWFHDERYKPPIYVLKTDSAGHAESVRYSATDFTFNDPEVRSKLFWWAKYRFTRSTAVTPQYLPLNYYFLSRDLADKSVAEDKGVIPALRNHTTPENEVEVPNIHITDLVQADPSKQTLAHGSADIEFVKLFEDANSGGVRKEYWNISVRFIIDPAQPAVQREKDPDFEKYNALGLIITYFNVDQAYHAPAVANTAAATPEGK